MASVLMDGRTVTVALSVTEKIEALHGDLVVPRTAVVRAQAVPDGLAEVHGPDMPIGWPTLSTVGTVRDFARNFDRVTFAVCHGRQPAVVLDLAGQPYDRIVVTVDNPGHIVSRLGHAGTPTASAAPS